MVDMFEFKGNCAGTTFIVPGGNDESIRKAFDKIMDIQGKLYLFVMKMNSVIICNENEEIQDLTYEIELQSEETTFISISFSWSGPRWTAYVIRGWLDSMGDDISDGNKLILEKD